MTSLARNGWGELDGKPYAGVRRVLQAVVDLCDHASGYGTATLGQIADTAGNLSTRWTSRCMRILEEIGVITWDRGGLLNGQPIPSTIRISKRRLALLARGAVGHLNARRKARADETRRRIRETLRLATQLPKKAPGRQNPLSIHAELSSPLLLTGESHPLHRGGVTPSPVENPSPAPTPAPERAHTWADMARQAAQQARRQARYSAASAS